MIIPDISMPAATRFEVRRGLKTSIKTNLIPVVIVSGSIDSHCAETVKSMGADACRGTAVNFGQLDHIVSRLSRNVDVKAG